MTLPPPDYRYLTPYPRDHYDGDPVTLARGLLGSVLVRVLPGDRVMAGRVVETEAYDCPRDPSCTAGRFHAARTQALAAAPGTFVFWVAHRHPLLQVTCRPEGIAASVLFRALEPITGVAEMLEHRPVTKEQNLTSGPAKLVQAFGLAPKFAGAPADGEELFLAPLESVPDEQVEITSRVGIQAGQLLPWHFAVRGSRWLSGGQPSMDLLNTTTLIVR